MKKLFFLLVILTMIACGASNTTLSSHLESIKTEQVQKSTMTETTASYNSTNFSDYCYEKNLPRDIQKWDLTPFRNAETGKVIVKYLYMTSEKDVFTMTLNIVGTDTTFVVTNRIQH